MRVEQPCLNEDDSQALLAEARKARASAYVPYSRFQVGAALLGRDGTVYHGCNVENASFGLTNCAERTAFFRAIADGCRPGDFVALAVVGDTVGPTSPCGACRQVLWDQCRDISVVMATTGGKLEETTLAALLPRAFEL